MAENWVREFGCWLESSGRAPRSVEAYLQDVGALVRWFEGEYGEGFEPGQLTGVDLRAFRAFCVDGRRVGAATWNRRRAGLGAFCAWLRETGVVDYDLMEGVEAWEEVGELAPRWLEAGEMRRVLRACELRVKGAGTQAQRGEALRDCAMVHLLVFAGLREGELVALNVGDVQVGERSGRVVVRYGKGGTWREVPLAREVRLSVQAWFDFRGDGPGALFSGKGSGRLSTRQVQRVVKGLGAMAGVDVTPHQLRHSCAKRMLDAGAPLTVVAKVLGHKRLSTTARYVAPGWGDLERAVEAVA